MDSEIILYAAKTVNQHAFKFHSTIGGGFFKKILITYNLGQNYWDKIEHLFFSEKPLFSQINVVRKVLGFWQQNLARFSIYIGGNGENLGFENWATS